MFILIGPFIRNMTQAKQVNVCKFFDSKKPNVPMEDCIRTHIFHQYGNLDKITHKNIKPPLQCQHMHLCKDYTTMKVWRMPRPNTTSCKLCGCLLGLPWTKAHATSPIGWDLILSNLHEMGCHMLVVISFPLYFFIQSILSFS